MKKTWMTMLVLIMFVGVTSLVSAAPFQESLDPTVPADSQTTELTGDRSSSGSLAGATDNATNAVGVQTKSDQKKKEKSEKKKSKDNSKEKKHKKKPSKKHQGKKKQVVLPQ